MGKPKRLILSDMRNVSVRPLAELGLQSVRILRIWSILSMDGLLTQTDKETGTKSPCSLEDSQLVHGVNVFLEDKTHDWFIRNDNLHFFSRIIGAGEPVELLVEYTDD